MYHPIPTPRTDEAEKQHAIVAAGFGPMVSGEFARQLERELNAAHAVLDADPSRIIRNAKDGYPEGRPDQVLTLAERVQSICRYASDYKRWFEERESELATAKAQIEKLKKHCRHRQECIASHGWQDDKCTCGLSKLLEEIKV